MHFTNLMDEKLFNKIFCNYYQDLIIYAYYYLHDMEECRDIVQSVFMKLWQDRGSLQLQNDKVKFYLTASVRNKALDYLRHQNITVTHKTEIDIQIEEMSEIEHVIHHSELYNSYCLALEKMPETLRAPFIMHREMGLKYKEIAQMLELSERTVESRMSKALDFLRIFLKDFLSVSLCLITNSIWI